SSDFSSVTRCCQPSDGRTSASDRLPPSAVNSTSPASPTCQVPSRTSSTATPAPSEVVVPPESGELDGCDCGDSDVEAEGSDVEGEGVSAPLHPVSSIPSATAPAKAAVGLTTPASGRRPPCVLLVALS